MEITQLRCVISWITHAHAQATAGAAKLRPCAVTRAGGRKTDLQLEELFVEYPGDRRYPLAEKITALPIAQLADVVAGWG